MKKHYAVIHDVFLDVREDMQDKNNWKVTGLCSAFFDEAVNHLGNYEHAQLFDAHVSRLMKKWPKSTGNTFYPIPSPQKGIQPEQAYHAQCSSSEMEKAHMWDKDNSPYAALRWELLDFLIETTKPE